jgi:Uma2 family endonuclease
MATRVVESMFRRITVAEFLEMDLGEGKFELDDGAIVAMAGGSPRHAEIATNVIAFLRQKLRGSGCKPFGSDMPTRTGDASIRYPDVSIYCGLDTAPIDDSRKFLGDPKVVFEVLSASTRMFDDRIKTPEYRGLPGVDAVVLIDGDNERIRLIERTGTEGW